MRAEGKSAELFIQCFRFR